MQRQRKWAHLDRSAELTILEGHVPKKWRRYKEALVARMAGHRHVFLWKVEDPPFQISKLEYRNSSVNVCWMNESINQQMNECLLQTHLLKKNLRPYVKHCWLSWKVPRNGKDGRYTRIKEPRLQAKGCLKKDHLTEGEQITCRQSLSGHRLLPCCHFCIARATHAHRTIGFVQLPTQN